MKISFPEMKLLQNIHQNRLSVVKKPARSPVKVLIGQNKAVNVLISDKDIKFLVSRGIVFVECAGYQNRGEIMKCGKWQLYNDPRQGLWFEPSEKQKILDAYKDIKGLDKMTSHTICKDCVQKYNKRMEERK